MKYLTPLSAWLAGLDYSEDYSDSIDMCEPEQVLSLADIIAYSAQGVDLNLRVYNDYDNSDEGSHFSSDYDHFDAMNDLKEASIRRSQSQVEPDPVLPAEPQIEPDPES